MPGEVPGDCEADLAMRFQQLSAPVMAKGVEDTAFYRYHRLVSLNEVGGDPGLFALAPAAFHRACLEAQESFPRTLLATSTHDTKRSADVRARLALLSEIPERWAAAVARWSAGNRRFRRGGFPDPDAEYLLYQTLVGAWPLPAARAALYMEKAAREAKRHTSWMRQDAGYETALRDFVDVVLADPDFTADLAGFVAPLVASGRTNALAQTLVQLTAPGVPDLYQGSELWDLSLVDPDNRRPVDYELRRALLGELAELAAGPSAPEAVLARADCGLPKLWTIRQALGLRRRRPELLAPESPYRPLLARGGRAAHAVAFARGEGSEQAITVVPRLVIGLDGDWGDTVLDLPAGRFRDQLSGEETAGGERRLADLLARFPVALLAPASDSSGPA
jgi:(1->4)-alpha-D-glucan 1-alpha-D-glucosylmutase